MTELTIPMDLVIFVPAFCLVLGLAVGFRLGEWVFHD